MYKQEYGNQNEIAKNDKQYDQIRRKVQCGINNAKRATEKQSLKEKRQAKAIIAREALQKKRKEKLDENQTEP